MREILFRGKRMEDGEWVHGSLVNGDEIGDRCPGIVDKESATWYLGRTQVDLIRMQSETVGQYTGLDDIDGTKIFEGDILEAKLDDESEHVTRVVVEWGDFGWQTHQPGCDPDDMTEDDIGIWKVAGNRWDNPELLDDEDAV